MLYHLNRRSLTPEPIAACQDGFTLEPDDHIGSTGQQVNRTALRDLERQLQRLKKLNHG